MTTQKAIESDWITPADFEQIYQVPTTTQAIWRSRGKPGLPYYKMGGNVRYKRSEIEAWLESRRRVNAGGEECQR